MSSYDVYGMGAALVDTEIEVDDGFLANAAIDKGVMTLVDEDRQHALLGMLEQHLVYARRASGGSAANSVMATRHFGGTAFYSCKVADDENGRFYLSDMERAGVRTNRLAAGATHHEHLPRRELHALVRGSGRGSARGFALPVHRGLPRHLAERTRGRRARS
jgi:hypothetical protein